MFFVYILQSTVARKFYTGYTDNLERRLSDHNNGRGIYSSRYIPWKIVYQEVFNEKESAISREKYLKSAAGRRWLKKNISL